ncbi:hypothetical protein YTPLAS72_18450 [Nitrospira sp.]|nr:hypothetical protein YTPLAS72_18450 [Nitrospira sp.]
MSLPRKLHETFIIDHPAEAGPLLDSFEIGEVVRLIESIPPNSIAVLLSSMNPAVASEILAALPEELAIQVVRETSPGDAAGLLARLERDRRKAIIRRLARPLAKEIGLFMEYPAESVGSLMDAGVFALSEDLTVEDAVTQVRIRAPKDLHDIYVIDRRRYLVGMFSVRDLLLLNPAERLQSVMRHDVPAIHPMENREEIVDLFAGRRLLTIPVVDLDGRLLGVIKNEDIVKASQEDATADLQTMVGASKDERALSPLLFSVQKRLGWLQVNLVTAFLAAFVVGMFVDVIAQFTALAVLLPVAAGQSGNTGAQSWRSSWTRPPRHQTDPMVPGRDERIRRGVAERPCGGGNHLRRSLLVERLCRSHDGDRDFYGDIDVHRRLLRRRHSHHPEITEPGSCTIILDHSNDSSPMSSGFSVFLGWRPSSLISLCERCANLKGCGTVDISHFDFFVTAGQCLAITGPRGPRR